MAEKTDNPTLAEGFRQLADQWRRSAKMHKSQEDLLKEEAALLAQRPERRREMRRRVLQAGRIVFNNRQSTLDCTVKNISSQGALVTLPSTSFVPEEIELCIGNETHKARVIWRAADKMGLAWRFLADESGVTAIEYGLIAGGIAVALLAAANSGLQGTFNVMANNLAIANNLAAN